MDLSGAKCSIPEMLRAPLPGVLHLRSLAPVLLPRPGAGRTGWLRHCPADLLPRALLCSLERRAGRPLDVRMSVMQDPEPARPVRLRHAGPGTHVMVPGFDLQDIRISGTPEDMAFVLFAGVGARTHLGFGFLDIHPAACLFPPVSSAA